MDKNELQKRMEQAIRLTAPGQPIRTALDMIIAGHLGALICVGDTENVLAAGNDGFPLNISFTSNRLFELSKMDGAIVIDGDLTQILRANFRRAFAGPRRLCRELSRALWLRAAHRVHPRRP